MKLILLLFAVAVLQSVNGRNLARYRRAAKNMYKMCVPEDLIDLCNEMASQETKSTVKIVCIPARDRIECITKIKEKLADFLTVDPEDMYVAKNEPGGDFAIFEEIRTKEEPDAEFRYEAVAVVHKDLNVSNVEGLRGLNSCHTGVGRNVGYRIPLTKLKQMGLIGNLAEPELSPRENELKAFSTLFQNACIVGKWSPDPKINLKLKRRYSNLCALCEHPEICDYPDKFSGYDGALRCLAHNGGQVAWTKVIFVRKFFGLPVGVSPAVPTQENPENFAYFCPDGSKVPVTETPCTWAARPWQGYMSNTEVAKSVDELRKKIESLNAVGSKNHAAWLEKVLEINDKGLPRENKIISPGEYLDKANYTDVVERDYGPPYKSIRFCVTSTIEEDKCRALSKSAFSRDIRPRFDCVLEPTVQDCMARIRDNGADIITLDGGLVDVAQKDYNLKPIVAEQYGPTGGSYYAVAVVKKDSTIQSFDDLRGKKSCHTGIRRTAGYNAPLYTLISKGLIKKKACPYPNALSEFFSGGSCLPGSKEVNLGLDSQVSEKLCSLCTGDVDQNNPATKCNFDQTEAFSGYTGAFRCLVQGGGDVAFVKHVTVPGNTDGNNKEPWALNLKSTDYELLCSEGGRAPVTDFAKCNLLQAPPHMVVTRNSKTIQEIDELRNALISVSEEYTERPDLFRLFGSFNGQKDLLFKDSATGLVSVTGDSEVQKKYSQVLAVVNAC
ncbi:transferrin [Cylas formicarius]|uniref:transferrin n=1 Tax=Cylas formicarius TaxID=197179 RepID=UPI0029588AFF|nr:transferrin [Cylas formicarius]